MTRFLPSLLIGALLSPTVFAQPNPARGDLRLLGGLGLSYYDGDLRAERLRNPHLRPNGNVGLSYRLGEHLSLRGEVGFYRIYGSDEGGEKFERNLSFRSDNPEFFLALSGNLLPFTRQSAFNLYAFGGLGLTRLNPKARLQGRYYSLPRLQTEGVAYRRVVPILPLGAGVSRSLSSQLTAALEIRYTYVFSDYLDDVSTEYPQPGSIDAFATNFSDRSPELGLPANPPGNPRGSPGSWDGYYFLQARLEYTLGSSQKAVRKRLMRCPKL